MNLAAYAVSLLYMLFLFTASPRAEITNNNFKITRSPLSDLLSQQTVHHSFQDSSGLLWFLTQEGLHRYDGYEVRRYQAKEHTETSISHNNVIQLLQDHSGKIWVATDGGGLNYYKSDAEQFQLFTQNAESSVSTSKNIRAMLQDENGYIWLGNRDGSVNIFDPFEGMVQDLRTLNLEAHTNGVITSFAIDDVEHMWIGTSRGGLIRYNRYTGKSHRFLTEAENPYSISSNHITALERDSNGDLWIGTESHGLMRMDRESQRIKRLEHRPNHSSSLSNDSINTVYRDRTGRIWVGTDGGLNLYDGAEKFIVFNSTNSNLANDLVLNLLQDKAGNYWIGTHYGLYTGFESRFEIFDSKRGLPAESITSFAETDSGELWVGSYAGLYVFNSSTKEFAPAGAVIPEYQGEDSRVMALSYHSNDLWVGYRANGVEKIRNVEDARTRSISNYREEEGISSNAITHIMTDTYNNTWISTYGGGLNLVSSDSVTPVIFRASQDKVNDLSSDFVFQVTQTQDGNILVSTKNGLTAYSRTSGSYKKIDDYDLGGTGFEAAIIQTIHESKGLDIWLGLHFQGLARLRAKGRAVADDLFQIIQTTPPLPSSTIYAIEEDNQGFLWLSTTNGLVRLDPATQKIITFDYSDGLQDNEFNFGASFKDSQGRLYFGGNKGYNRFHPEDVIRATEPPPMVMTSIRIAGLPIGFDVAYQRLSTLHLQHNDQFVNLEFSALDYTDPQKNRYQYRLQNFDRQWIDLGARNNISLTNLPSGVYQLQIKGANSEGVWNHDGLHLTLMVYPPPWLSWWAFSCYGAIGLWLLWFFRRYYDNYLLRERATENAATMHVAAERAMDDLQDQLEMEQVLVRNVHNHAEDTLKIIASLLSKQADSIGDESILELFSENQERFSCLQQVEKNLYYVADRLEVNFHGFVEDLIAARFKGQPFANVDIAVVNEANEIGIPAAIALPAAMITNEIFCNSIKHAFSSARGVHYIRIAMEENIQLSGWTLEISDSGSGLPTSIDPNHPTTLGMEIVQHFAQTINAELKVSRQHGTQFSVEIPKPLPGD